MPTMYKRLLITDSDNGATVCAIVFSTTNVTLQSAYKWAEHVAQDCDNKAGVAAGHHVIVDADYATAHAALTKLGGIARGGGGNYGARPKTQCPVCGQLCTMRRDGTMTKHGYKHPKYSDPAYNNKALRKHCAGSGKPGRKD